MTPSEFLRAVWPSQGYYCVARPAKEYKGFIHKVFETVDEAAKAVVQDADKHDLYFCMHTLHEPKVWNPNKVNKKTGEKGAYEVRVQTNTKECKCFFFDLDVGEGPTKYASQEDALFGLKQFCTKTGLARPLVSSSGGGLHVFWILDAPLPTEEWRVYAAKLKALAKHHGLLADPMRTTDSSSVLRIPGTFNFKKDEKRAVQILCENLPGDFLSRIDAAMSRDGIVVSGPVEKQNDLGDNLSLYADRPPVKMESLESACAQIRRNIENQAALSEPAWFHTLNLVRFVEDAETHIHRVSDQHPNYSKEETEEKVANQRAKGSGPTLCTTMADYCGGDVCHECPYFGKVKSPLVAAYLYEQEEKPVDVVTEINGAQTTVTVPPPPWPYKRLEKGGIGTKGKNKKGDDFTEVIYEHDFFAVRRISGEDIAGDSKDHSVWRAILPFEGAKDFSIPSKVIYDKIQLLGFLAERSVIIPHDKGDLIRAYMIAYIAHLQKLEMAERQVNSLGWSSDYSYFALSDKAIYEDGTVKPLTLGGSAAICAQSLEKKGTLEQQIALMQFYNRPEYIPNQFFIVASLAAPFLFATGYAGAVMNASGAPGASKSTSLYTGASFWGKPKLYPMNGTANGATFKARFEQMRALSNLPICIDELTHILCKDANNMVMNASQYGARVACKRDGSLKDTPDNEKSTFMLTTSNNSLHSVLAEDNAAATAGSMRLFEIIFRKSTSHAKYEADEYLRALNENYGHIGEAFMMYAVPHRNEIAARIQKKMKAIDIRAKFDPSERFWSGMAAAVLAIAEVSYEQKLLPFEPSVMETWVLEEQVPAMREVIGSEYTTPLATLSDFISKHIDKILVVRKAAVGNTPTNMIIKDPRGGLYGHYDLDKKMLWISYTEFNNFCKEKNINIIDTLKGLEDMISVTKEGRSISVLARNKHKFRLGKGTTYAMTQPRCFSIHMDHPEVSGAIEMDVVENPAVATTPPTGDLKVV